MLVFILILFLLKSVDRFELCTFLLFSIYFFFFHRSVPQLKLIYKEYMRRKGGRKAARRAGVNGASMVSDGKEKN